MKSAYSVLVVDNRENVCQQARSQTADLDGVALETASSVDEARARISSNFFNLAFVDLKLDDGFESGREILSDLQRNSPVTERVAMSRYVRSDGGKILNLVSPFSHVADAVMEKDLATEWFSEVVRGRLERWRSERIEVIGLENLIEDLTDRRRAKRLGIQSSPDYVRAEVEYIISGLFGGYLPSFGQDGEAKLELRARMRGLSPSVVVEVVPQLGSDSQGRPVFGNRCMVKLGARDSTVDEVRRYDKQVRYGVRLESRVELLGSCEGNRLAGICYSFAGGSDSEVRSIDEKIRDTHEGSEGSKLTAASLEPARSAVDYLFGVDSRQWYGVSGRSLAPGRYFEQELRANLIDKTRHLSNWAQSVAERSGGRWKASEGALLVHNTKLLLPTPRIFGSAIFAQLFPSCLAHGDMHGGNILMDDAGRISLIDYAHSGFGPRPIDAAVLNGSVRLWDSWERSNDDIRSKRTWSWLDKRCQVERQHLMRLVSGNSPDRIRHPWLRIASTLDKRLFENFKDEETPVSAEEMVAVYSLQASRLLSLSMSEIALLRVAAWSTPLLEYVQKIDN